MNLEDILKSKVNKFNKWSEGFTGVGYKV
jgi:hypothetical protein